MGAAAQRCGPHPCIVAGLRLDLSTQDPRSTSSGKTLFQTSTPLMQINYTRSMQDKPWEIVIITSIVCIAIDGLANQLAIRAVIITRFYTKKISTFIDYIKLSKLANIEQMVVTATVSALTLWIIIHPDWTLWHSITQPSESPKNTMLGATSIIALLTFVTASSANAAKEQEDGGKYLKQPLSTYVFHESLFSKFLWVPEFSLLTMAVFTIPFIVDSVGKQESALSKIHGIQFSPHLLVTSLWCACFAIVSVTLASTSLALLRGYIIRILQPEWVLNKIESALRFESDKTVKKHFSLLPENDRSLAYYWVYERVSDLTEIPQEQHWSYIDNTLATRRLKIILQKRSRFTRFLILICSQTLTEGKFYRQLQSFSQTLATHAIRSTTEIMALRNNAYSYYLCQPDISIPLRLELTDLIINESLQMIEFRRQLRNGTNTNNLGRQQELEADTNLVSLEAHLPESTAIPAVARAASRPTDTANSSKTELLETLTAATFRDLAYFIRERIGLTCSGSSTEYVKRVITRADRISDTATRLYSLKEVIGATIYASVSNFTQGTRLSLSILNEIGEEVKESASQFTDNAFKDSQNEIFPPNLKRVILDNVRSTFASYPYMCPEVYSQLLTMIPDSDVRPTFLHYLTFNTYQGLKVDLDVLSSFDARLTVPFYYSLAGRIPADHYPQHFKRYLHSGMTGLNSEGINWLFGILEEEVDCRLYSKYLKLRYNNGLHTGFDTVLLWRIMAGDDFNSVLPVCVRDANLDIEDYQLTRLREEAGEAAKVLDSLGKNVEADKLRYSFGVPIPKDIGNHDAQGPEDAS